MRPSRKLIHGYDMVDLNILWDTVTDDCLTEEVGLAACRKGWLKMPEPDFKAKDWAGQINELARKEAYNSPRSPLISANLKDDLHSFRNARNLVDHKVQSRREDTKRQKQFAERMMQGARLVAELVSIKRKIK